MQRRRTFLLLRTDQPHVVELGCAPPSARRAWRTSPLPARSGRGPPRRPGNGRVRAMSAEVRIRPATSERDRVPALISGSSGSLPSVAMVRSCLSAYRNAGLSVQRAKLIPANALGGGRDYQFHPNGIRTLEIRSLGRLAQGVDAVLLLPGGPRWRNPAARTRPMSLWPFHSS